MWKSLEKESIRYLYEDLYTVFQKSEYKKILLKQLKEYITFVTLLKIPKEELEKRFDFKNEKIALYGAGGFGQAFYGEYRDNIRIWVDKNYQQYSGKEFVVDSIEALLKDKSYDLVFIAILNEKICENVENFLIKEGIKKPIYYFKKSYIK